jgi:hypothetical protein
VYVLISLSIVDHLLARFDQTPDESQEFVIGGGRSNLACFLFPSKHPAYWVLRVVGILQMSKNVLLPTS